MPNPPKMNPQRGDRGRGVTKLPSEGRRGPTPKWPIPDDEPSTAERKAWKALWVTPQSVMWERLGWTRTVARYCRLMVESEMPGAKVTLHAQVTSMEDRLGLTPKAMRLLLWEIVTDEVAVKRAEATSARGRIKAVG